jgi:HEAT repeat protein
MKQVGRYSPIDTERAARSLIEKRDPTCVKAILPLALSQDFDIQSRAVMVLSHFIGIAGERIWEYFGPLLAEGDKQTKLRVLFSLEDLPLSQAATALMRIFAKSRDSSLRASAVACMVPLVRRYPKLRGALARIFMQATRSRNAQVRGAGLEGVYELNDRRFIKTLLRARDDSALEIRLRYPDFARKAAGLSTIRKQ